MMKRVDMNKLIIDMYVDAIMAGSSLSRAREERDRLLEEVADLYAELEQEAYAREQLQVELNRAYKRLDGMKKFYHFYGSKLTDPDNPDSPLWSDFAPTEDDIPDADTEPDEEVPDHHDAFDSMFPGCTPDDLPFPDVEDLEGASGLLGGDE